MPARSPATNTSSTTTCHPVEIHVIRLADIALMTNPFELFLDYGNQIRARSLAAQRFLVQLACGSEGYLPTAKAERGGITPPTCRAASPGTRVATCWCAKP